MKTLKSALLTLVFAGSHSLLAQGIINGGFESYDQTTKFLEGWKVRFYDGTGNLSTVINGVTGSLVPYRVIDPQRYFATIYGTDSDPGGMPIGNYYLFGQGTGSLSIVAEQFVVVPNNVKTLQYRAFRGYIGGVSVQVDGIGIEPQLKTIITPGGFYGTVADWWIDVSNYAGHGINLVFGLNDTGVGLDDVHFSSEPIPEPTSCATFGMGFVGLAALYLRMKKRPI